MTPPPLATPDMPVIPTAPPAGLSLVSFARRPVTILVLVLAAIVAGVLAIERMPATSSPTWACR